MDKRELVRDMITETRERLRRDGWRVRLEEDMESPKGRSLSVKIRVHDDLRKTIDYLDTVIGHAQNRNVDWITIHPRTRYTPSTTPIFKESLEILLEKYSATLPILLSGDIFDLSTLPIRNARSPRVDVSTLTIRDDDESSPLASQTNKASETPLAPTPPTPSTTHLSGFMSARGLLANPALYAGYRSCPWEAVETLMCRMAKAPLPYKLALHHIQEMTAPGMGPDKTALLSKKERAELNALGNMAELVDFLDRKVEEHTGRIGGMRRDL
ncbi:hypothetical protein UVI_02039810 [Ustilaginoidea virens]|nr:hypothetical protein UVI_02039810 [Ustilaginoidea virens]